MTDNKPRQSNSLSWRARASAEQHVGALPGRTVRTAAHCQGARPSRRGGWQSCTAPLRRTIRPLTITSRRRTGGTIGCSAIDCEYLSRELGVAGVSGRPSRIPGHSRRLCCRPLQHKDDDAGDLGEPSHEFAGSCNRLHLTLRVDCSRPLRLSRKSCRISQQQKPRQQTVAPLHAKR